MHMPQLLQSQSHIMIHYMNHDYIGSLWQCQMSQKAIEFPAVRFIRTRMMQMKRFSPSNKICSSQHIFNPVEFPKVTLQFSQLDQVFLTLYHCIIKGKPQLAVDFQI